PAARVDRARTGAGDGGPAQLACAPGAATTGMACVVAVAHVVAVTRRRGVAADICAGAAAGAGLAARHDQWRCGWVARRARASGTAGRTGADRLRAGDGRLHGDDLRVAQTHSRVA